MNDLSPIAADNKPDLYAQVAQAAAALLKGENDFIANAANVASLLYHSLPQVSWAGFYVCRGRELVLGPFQGKTACVRIAIGKGVCGTCARDRRTIIVPDVHEFPGHIACDSASRSEIVLPLIVEGHLAAVLDLDSPVLNRFDADDEQGLEQVVAVFLAGTLMKSLSEE